jgi:hypothetical protein
MRTLVCGACALIAIGLMVVSATLSYRFSFGLGGTPLEAHAYALAAAGIDILKGFMPFVIYLRVQEQRRLAAAAGLLVFAFGVLWSFTSAMGLAAQVRMDKANTSDNRQAAYREAKALLARIENQQARIARVRAATEIAGEIEGKLAAAVAVGKQTKTIAAVTDQCARPTRATVETCATVWQLRQELTAAREWDRLESEARGMRLQIEALRRSGAGDLATADAQADFLARTIGVLLGRDVDVAWMRLAVVVLLGFLLEVGSSCGLYVALESHTLPTAKLRPVGDTTIANAQQPGEVADYAAARLTAQQGARVTMGKAHADYELWCVANRLEPLPRKHFLRELRGEAERNGWSVAGGVVHHTMLTPDLQDATADAISRS